MKRIVVVLCGVLLSLLLLGCNTDANYQQGRELFLKGDYEQAAKLLQKSGDKGAGLLGVLYYWGKGVEQSWSSARSCFSCAAGTKDRADEIEDPIVWFYMGNMYLIGESESAIQDLTKSRIAHYDRFKAALECYEQARKTGYDKDDIDLRIGILRSMIETYDTDKLSCSSHRCAHSSTFYGRYDGYGKEGWGYTVGGNVNPRLQLFRLGHWTHNEIDSPCLEVAWVEDLYNSGKEHVFIQLNGVCYNSDGSKSPSMIFSEDI